MMQLNKLPGVERGAIELLLDGDEMSALRKQLNSVVRISRTESGAGVYIVFELDERVERLTDKINFHIDGVFATSPNCEEIGFILFVKDGVIEYLEAYVYGDVYPQYEGCDFSLSRQPAERDS